MFPFISGIGFSPLSLLTAILQARTSGRGRGSELRVNRISTDTNRKHVNTENSINSYRNIHTNPFQLCILICQEIAESSITLPPPKKDYRGNPILETWPAALGQTSLSAGAIFRSCCHWCGHNWLCSFRTRNELGRESDLAPSLCRRGARGGWAEDSRAPGLDKVHVTLTQVVGPLGISCQSKTRDQRFYKREENGHLWKVWVSWSSDGQLTKYKGQVFKGKREKWLRLPCLHHSIHGGKQRLSHMAIIFITDPRISAQQNSGIKHCFC